MSTREFNYFIFGHVYHTPYYPTVLNPFFAVTPLGFKPIYYNDSLPPPLRTSSWRSLSCWLDVHQCPYHLLFCHCNPFFSHDQSPQQKRPSTQCLDLTTLLPPKPTKWSSEMDDFSDSCWLTVTTVSTI